jgi:hypothetical protein
MSTSDTAILTATVLDNTTAISGITVTFKEGTTVLGTSTTNSSGVARYSYTPKSEGSKVITATTTATSNLQFKHFKFRNYHRKQLFILRSCFLMEQSTKAT